MKSRIILTSLCLLLAGPSCTQERSFDPSEDGGIGLGPGDWPSYGRSAGEQHFSPLTEIDTRNVAKLNLAWFHDLPAQHSASQPIEAGGLLFTATGHSDVRAFDAVTGELKWMWESHAAERSGVKLRQGYGPRGLAYHRGHVIVATHDGRLVSLDARTGRVDWTTQTIDPKNNAYITGAPRAFDGKVIIGFAGADGGGVRGYVSCYDAVSGRQLWRFYTVPGNPAIDRDETTRRAAKTWTGEWWKAGGGGTAWNSLVYDPELKRFYIGTGNGYPYNQALRSPAGGDNLYLSSIVALDANTGSYIWHYQINPGEQWDYKATQDITLATLKIDGKPRKVLMQAPTNGFFYVIDRTDGKLISATPFVKTTWASSIDIKTGRPVENPGARYHGKGLFEMWPNIVGGHSWPPQSYSPRTGLVYIPTIERGMLIGDKGIDLSKEKTPENPTNINAGMGVTGDFSIALPGEASYLQAWDPVARKARWKVRLPGAWPAGTMATAGDLVFQGRLDNRFDAYDARNGKRVWSYNVGAPIVAAPISYQIDGRQYVSVITGNGGAGGGYHGRTQQAMRIDYRTQARRVLTFALGGRAVLPPTPAPEPLRAPSDPDYRADAGRELLGNMYYHMACGTCHGGQGMAAGTAPDLRTSAIPANEEAFLSIVRDGALVPNGMPRFEDMPPDQIAAIRQYLRSLGRTLPEK